MGAPVVVLIIGFGQKIGLLLLILVATSQGLIEFYRLTFPESQPKEKTVWIGVGLLLPLGAYFGQAETILVVMALAVVALFLLFLAKPGDFGTLMSRMAFALFGIIYVSFLLSHILLLRNELMGTRWVFFLLFTIWACDTAAYFTGTLIGRHKLYPKVSPKKSVEGLLGGLGGSVTVALLFRQFFLPHLTLSQAVMLAFLMMILGQAGDFAESMIKRSANVKDSSRLVPGHGGILDRLDSFLFSAPFLYYYVRMVFQ